MGVNLDELVASCISIIEAAKAAEQNITGAQTVVSEVITLSTVVDQKSCGDRVRGMMRCSDMAISSACFEQLTMPPEPWRLCWDAHHDV